VRITRTFVLLGLSGLAAALAVSPASAQTKSVPLVDAPADALRGALVAGALTEAEYALERARALFRPAAVERRFGTVGELHPRAATFVLRDLALRLDELEGEDRSAAERLLARPSDGVGDVFGDGWSAPEAAASPVCEARATPRWCIHWVETTADAPPQAGAAGDGVPDWIDGTAAATAKVFAREVDELGFPRPQDDSDSVTTNPAGNPDGALDVYLADVGADGLYGYCTTDDPGEAEPGTWDVSGTASSTTTSGPASLPA
jgi:hypothetical protein